MEISCIFYPLNVNTENVTRIADIKYATLHCSFHYIVYLSGSGASVNLTPGDSLHDIQSVARDYGQP